MMTTALTRSARAGMTGLVLFASLVVATPASAAPPGIDTTGATLYTFGAIEWCPNSSVVSSWAGTRGGDIDLGRFGSNGKVTGGDAVLVLSVDIGSAPVTQLWLGQGIAVTPSSPTASGTVGTGSNWNNGLGFQPELTTKSDGAGTAVVRFALLTRSNQSWTKAPGVTVDLNIVVGSCLGAVGAQTEWPLTIGGGAP